MGRGRAVQRDEDDIIGTRRLPQVVANEYDFGLFAAPVIETPTRDILGMVRGSDPIESQRAAVDILPKCREIQELVYAALERIGPMTDPQLTDLPEFTGLGESTVRTRRAELVAQGRVVKYGRVDKHSVWGIA